MAEDVAANKVFTTFRGDVIFFSLTNTGIKEESCIEAQIFGFSKSCRSFTRIAKKMLPLGILGGELELVSSKCLLNSTTGMYQPFILLHQNRMKHSSTQELHVLLLDNFYSVILSGSFDVSHLSPTQNIEFYFCDGPTICWTFKGVMYFASYDSIHEKFTTDSVTVDHSMDERSGVEFNLLWCGLLRDQIVAMGAKSEMKDDSSTLTRWACVNHTCNDIQEVSLVPSVYVPIATCCLVREPLNVAEFGGNSSYDDVDVYLATNRGQVLNFLNGRLKSYWQLPFKDPSRMWILELTPDEVMVIIASKSNRVALIDCRKKQVLKELEEVACVLTDDFLENGNEQVLLLPPNLTISDSGEFSKFYLLDVAKGMVAIENNQDSLSAQSQTVTDSLQKTASALRTTLQARESNLREAKMEYHEKLKMVEHCCKVLKDITCSSGACKEEKRKKSSGLQCLLEGDLREVKSDMSSLLRSEPVSALNVKEIWQRILYDQWLIGVDVENTGERTVCDLTVGLVSCQSMDTSYLSKTAYCSNHRYQCQQRKKGDSSDSFQFPSLKKKRLEHPQPLTDLQQLSPGNQTSLTAVCSLPRFALFDSCTMNVVVTWRSYHDNGSTDQHAMHCGQVTLCVAQVVDKSLQLNRSLDSKSLNQDIAALRSVSIETELVLQRSISKPHHIIALLKSSVKEVPVIQTRTGGRKDIYGQLISVLHESGPLGGTGIFPKNDLQEGKVTLITRNKDQVFLLLHRLRQILPDDVRILADPERDISAVKNSLTAINQEITNLEQNLRNMLQKSSKSHRGPLVSDGRGPSRGSEDGDGIAGIRENFERKRAREMTEKEEGGSGMDDFEKFWDDVVNDQMRVDQAVAEV